MAQCLLGDALHQVRSLGLSNACPTSRNHRLRLTTRVPIASLLGTSLSLPQLTHSPCAPCSSAVYHSEPQRNASPQYAAIGGSTQQYAAIGGRTQQYAAVGNEDSLATAALSATVQDASAKPCQPPDAYTGYSAAGTVQREGTTRVLPSEGVPTYLPRQAVYCG